MNTFRKTTLPSLLLLAALAGTGCADDALSAQADFGSPRSLALSGQNLFVAATDAPRLRVINLNSQRVVRAPNPLFSLSVPTVALPRAVASWRSVDGAISSPFVFTLSTVEPRVSIASAERRLLIGQLVTPEIPLDIAVTALADAADDTVAYISAMVDGAGALFSFSLPAALAESSIETNLVELTREDGIDLSDTIPQRLVASPTDPSLLAIANRAPGSAGVLLVNVADKTVTPVDVGGPASTLAFDPTGTRLFGLIDSEACLLARETSSEGATDGEATGDSSGDASDGTQEGDASEGDGNVEAASAPTRSSSTVVPGSQGPESGEGLGDCSGLFAIDVATAAPIESSPLRVPGVLRGVAAAGAVTLKLPDDSKRDIDPFVLVTSSEGALYPVDGAALTLINAQEEESGFELTHVEPNGRSSYNETAPSEIAITEGRAASQTVSILYEGLLPALSEKRGVLEADGLSSAGTDFAALGVEVGDRVEIDDAEEACESFTVTAVAVGLLSLEGVPETCLGSVTYGVRAGGTYLVSGEVSGLMGRVAEGETFEFMGEALYELGLEVAETPALSFVMTGSDPRVDAGWTIEIEAGVEPFVVPLSSIIMPGAIVSDPATSDFYVAYQGGSAILRVVPSKLEHESVSTSDGLSVFR